MAEAAAALKPVGGVLLLLLPALGATLSRELAELMVYDRAAILQGEIWRLVSGHWVHFSSIHLLYDGLVLGGCAWFVRRRGYPAFAASCLLTALLIGLGLLLWQPGLAYYGGLSALALSGTVLAGLLALEEKHWRGFGLGLLLLGGGRLLYDLYAGSPMLTGLDAQGIVTVPLSHFLGALCGLLLWIPRGRRLLPGAASPLSDAPGQACPPHRANS